MNESSDPRTDRTAVQLRAAAVVEATASTLTSAADLTERRRCLLHLGATLVAGGIPVTDVERTLRELGASLGSPDLRVVAMSNGLFLALDQDSPLGFEPVTVRVRFDQTEAALQVGRDLVAGRTTVANGWKALGDIRIAPAAYPGWVGDLGCIAVGPGLALILVPTAANVLWAVAGALVVAGMSVATRFVDVLRPLLPFAAPLAAGCIILTAARSHLLDAPVPVTVCAVALSLPGTEIVTGLAEVVAGGAVSGVSRLVSSTLQLVLFTAGLLTAATVTSADGRELAGTAGVGLGEWAPWLGLVLVWLGVAVSVFVPRKDLPWTLLVMAGTYLALVVARGFVGAAIAEFLAGVFAALLATAVHFVPGGPFFATALLPSFWILAPGSLSLLGAVELASNLQEGALALGGIGLGALGIALGAYVGTAISLRLPAVRNASLI